MREIYLNEGKRREMAENARRYVDQYFSPHAISQRLDVRLQVALLNSSDIFPR
jgi:hypothetical protein